MVVNKCLHRSDMRLKTFSFPVFVGFQSMISTSCHLQDVNAEMCE